MRTGAVGALWLIWLGVCLGVCLAEYVRLLGCWQVHKSQITLKSLTLLQPHGEEECLAFEEISAALYQYRILST